MAGELWIVGQSDYVNDSLLKSFHRTTRLTIEKISEIELRQKLKGFQRSQGTGNVPILILIDFRFPKKDVEEIMKCRNSSLWHDQKFSKSPLIDFFIPSSPKVSGEVRKTWSDIIETYPDDYHFYTVDQLRSEMVILEKKARTRRLYAEYGGMVMAPTSPLQEIKKYVDKLADTETNIQITGENGTGKELIARALHFRGRRAQGNFVPVHCSAIPQELFEGELFGYKKGAFTGAGAIRDHKGYLQQADNGTLFLDEIGEMPLFMQVKLLRVLQEREVRPLGATETIKVDIRVISATWRDLDEEIKKGNFREDLLYRLSGWVIELPPLRERGKDDLLMLINHFLIENTSKVRGTYKRIEEPALRALLEYPWPGNVRELDNMIERALISCEVKGKERIELDDLQLKPLRNNSPNQEMTAEFLSCTTSVAIPHQLNPHHESELTLNHRDQIILALEQSQGKIARAAKLLTDAGYKKGASRGRLRNLLGLSTTQDAADPELREWYTQKYSTK